MTINIADNTPRVSYAVAQGVTQTSFTVNFEFFDAADLNVYVDGTLKTLTTDYTVSGGDGSTGSVSISVTGATGGSTVVITRDIALERTTDFPASGAFQINSLNTELDRLTAIAADLQDKADRALQVEDYDTEVSFKLPLANDRKGKTLAFNETTGAVEAGPSIADVQTVSAASADIATLADIEDGTDATDAIQTVAGISSNVTTVAGIAANVSTVAGIQSDVTAVAADATDIGTVATNIASVNTVAGNISEVIAVANDLNEAVSEVETVANDLNEAVSEIETVAASISNVDTVGTNIANVNTVAGIDSNVTTVAGISANVTTVAGISGNVTTVAGISSDVTTVAADGTDIGTVATNIANVNSVAGNATNINNVAGNATNINTVAGISADVTTVAGDSADIQAVAADATDIGTVSTNIANVNTVAGSIANVNTTAANITGVNSFAERYRVGATDPTTSLDEGDLFFNTTDNTYKFYDGSSWQTVNVSGIGSVLDDATPQLGGNLDVNGNDITFGDNDKAVFGAGSDLQIYHDASHSYIIDNGTGNLRLKAQNFQVLGNADDEAQIEAYQNDGVYLYFNGNQKLATTATGVDVTGTVTADGLTVDVTSTTGQTLHNSAGSSVYTRYQNNSGNDNYIGYTGNNFDVFPNNVKALTVASGGDISFYSSDGLSQGLFWDASTQRLGLGTTSPSVEFEIASSAPQMRITDTDTNAVFQINASSTTGGVEIQADATDVGSNPFIAFDVGGSEKVRILDSGNVGIGTASPVSGYKLEIENSTGNAQQLITAGTNYNSTISFGDQTANTSGQIVYAHNGDYMRFDTNGSEAMRIDSSGNLLVGTTSLNIANNGSNTGFVVNSNGALEAGSSSTVLTLNRQSTDGEVARFQKAGATVGSIGVVNGDIPYFTAAEGTSGLKFNGDGSTIAPCNATGGILDDITDLGSSGGRFKDAHFSGTVNANAFVGDGSGLTGIGGAVGLTDVGSFIMGRTTDTTTRSAGTTLSASSVRYSNVAANASGTPSGTLRVHGYVNGSTTSGRTTVFQRIS